MMKNYYLLILALFFTYFNAGAQTPYNPFTQNIHFTPEPTVFGFQCGTVQTVYFTQGLTTADDANLWATEPLVVNICIGGFQFNGPATSIVSGTYSGNFDWAISTTNPNCLIGTQKQTLPGTGLNPVFPNPLATGTIGVSLFVPANSPVGTVLSVNVNLQVPPYMATFNSAPDDDEITQTQTFCNCYALTDAGTISANQVFCDQGDPLIFNTIIAASGGSGGNIIYQWQELLGTTWTDISGATDETYDAPSTQVTKQFRRNAKRDSCPDWLSSNTLSITINASPIVTAGIDKNLNCLLGSAQIGMSAVAGNSYSWTPSIGLNSSFVSQPIASPVVTTIYTITATSINGCTASDVVVVNVNITVPVANAGIDKYLNCNLPNETIGTAAVAGNSYSWSPSIGLNLTNIAQPNVSVTTTTNYTVTVTNISGCTAADVVVVNANFVPPFADAGIAKIICHGDSVTIGTVALAGNTYSWGPSYGLTSYVIAQPIASPLNSTTYTVTVKGSNGCTATDIIFVTVDTCLVDISGTVYNDTNALTNLNVDGIGIAKPDSVQLYANLINQNGNVYRVTTISSNGTYYFLNIPTNLNYEMVLSTIEGTIGLTPPLVTLPGTWVNTGEDCCDQVGDDGNPDGIVLFNISNYAKINIDFGIKDPNATGSLPLQLESFYAFENNCQGLLSWTTLFEENTSHVDIFRKNVGQGPFRKIATVQSAGNSDQKKVYSYLDKEVLEDATYEYQLKFVDIDGQYTVSDIRTMKMNCSLSNSSINIFPVPASDLLHILYVTEQSNSELVVDLLDVSGRIVLSKSQSMDNGATLMTMDISNLAKGTYILRYHDREGLFKGAEKISKY